MTLIMPNVFSSVERGMGGRLFQIRCQFRVFIRNNNQSAFLRLQWNNIINQPSYQVSNCSDLTLILTLDLRLFISLGFTFQSQDYNLQRERSMSLRQLSPQVQKGSIKKTLLFIQVWPRRLPLLKVSWKPYCHVSNLLFCLLINLFVYLKSLITF